MVIKPVITFLSACFMISMLPFISDAAVASPSNMEAAEITKEDSITIVERGMDTDSFGNVTMAITVADDVALPVTMVMKGTEGSLSLTVTYQGQSIKIKPGTYRITKVTDGDGKKLDAGAELTIPEEGGKAYLDFRRPNDTEESVGKQFLLSNLLFIPLVILLYACYRWYKKYFLH